MGSTASTLLPFPLTADRKVVGWWCLGLLVVGVVGVDKEEEEEEEEFDL